MVPLAGRGSSPIARTAISITGIVQGVGFRPFVFRLAVEMGLNGWVRNSPEGVQIEVSGMEERLAHFIRRIRSEAPPLAVITGLHHQALPDDFSEDGFTILESGAGNQCTTQVAPDAALCSDCLRELLDPSDRRYRYPFITCTNCGPRYSIITAIPYDRPNTTMAGFPLCPDCLREYHDPLDRRFHAQPVACPVCGPQVSLLDASGALTAERDSAVTRTIDLLKTGAIAAVKGIGGYHLVADACNTDAVARLRERKQRDEKPFAVMVTNLESARNMAQLDDMEERLLASVESPVVIVRRGTDCPVSALVAPGNSLLGLMLPYTPIHHLLFSPQPAFGHPLPVGEGEMSSLAPWERERMRDHRHNFTALVMTSANLSDEPIAFQDADALQRLSGIADCFLLHDRPIHTRSDDSVIRVFQGRPLFYRRARGYAPRAILLPFQSPPVLAVGAELKNAVCLVKGRQAFLSQHIGDLQSDTTNNTFRQTIQHMGRLLEFVPETVACDLHPDYLSSVYADESRLPLVKVQHHHAHLAACMAENGLEGESIGLIFDGTGYGSDGTIWGGEFLIGGYNGFRRAGHFRQLRLPGGDAAVREPWRMALAYLYQAVGETAFVLNHPVAGYLSTAEKELFFTMLEKGINSPLTSSCGRLFDAVAALLNIRHIVSYDGQAAIELEALAEQAEYEEVEKSPFVKRTHTSGLKDSGGFDFDVKSKSPPAPLYKGGSYAYRIIAIDDHPFQLDFSLMFPEILTDLNSGIQTAVIAHRFHVTVASAAVDVCLRISKATGLDRIVLSGGVFQNRLLTEMIYTALTQQGLQVFTHRLTPPNDGCIALGQAAVAGWQTRRNN